MGFRNSFWHSDFGIAFVILKYTMPRAAALIEREIADKSPHSKNKKGPDSRESGPFVRSGQFQLHRAEEGGPGSIEQLADALA